MKNIATFLTITLTTWCSSAWCAQNTPQQAKQNRVAAHLRTQFQSVVDTGLRHQT